MACFRKYWVHLMAAGFAIALFSCDDDVIKKSEEELTFETVEPTQPVVNVFIPYKVMMTKHRVVDFDRWNAGYKANDSMRRAFDISHFLTGRGSDNPKMVFVIDKITDFQKGKDFSKLPELKKAMQKSGVAGRAIFAYADVVRNDDSKIEQKERVMINQRVKDFDAWLKVFDAEGASKRKENGMIDRFLARGADDPNIVFIEFAITDMAKTKARINSPELKKILADAGVTGRPQIIYYTIAD